MAWCCVSPNRNTDNHYEKMRTMKKWMCVNCGWMYDEALGDLASGLQSGTAWEDVPDDWACPDCGLGKADFEMVEV